MRSRPVALFIAACFVFVILCLHVHILQIGEVMRTYATFHRIIDQQPELLYRYPEDVVKDKSVSVPKIIHQVALGDGNISRYDASMRSCMELHAGWEHRLWTDSKAVDFLRDNYPSILRHYKGYTQDIQRANVLRYAVLHKFGGVYVDLDVSCRVALDSTPLTRLPFVTPGAHPAGINNAFIATIPRHPLLTQVMDAVAKHDMYWGLPMRVPYVENMMSTGCMFISNQWMSYVRDLLSGRQDQPVFVLADAGGAIEPHMLRGKVTTPLFAHGGSSSWHSWDAALILAIGEHYLLFVALVLGFMLSLAGVLIVCPRVLRGRPWLRSNSWLSGIRGKMELKDERIRGMA